MQTTLNHIDSTDYTYNVSSIRYSFDGFTNGKDYVIKLEAETQSPNGGTGMLIIKQENFNVEYGELKLKIKPIITQLDEQAANKADWADLAQNPGVISGDYNFIKNWIIYNNTALSLSKGSVLTYNTKISSTFTEVFMEKLSLTYNGLIFQSTDGLYQFGYDSSKKQFYTTIQGKTVWSSSMRITENPFIFTLLPDRVKIRQYNIYNKVRNCVNFKIKDMYDFPSAFMARENN